MQQAAYDFARFETANAAQKQKEKAAKLHAVQGGKKAPSRWHEVWLNLQAVVAVTLFLALAVGLLQSKVTITELTTEIQRTQTQLTTEQSTYNYLSSALNGKTSMANVEEVANRLGLMKLDDSQITYVRLDESSVITRAPSDVEKWTEFLYSGVLSLIEKLDF
ncbi:MAG: cell division protein FtsL [Faecalibacterium sp.]|nr:cell division protein FtsL [Faecalibacterium sp.]